MTSKMTLPSKDFDQSQSSLQPLRKLPHLQVSSAGHSPVSGLFSKLLPLRLFTLILNFVYMCLSPQEFISFEGKEESFAHGRQIFVSI